jgi:hypothetical protein
MKQSVLRLFLASLKYVVNTVVAWYCAQKTIFDAEIVFLQHKSVVSNFDRLLNLIAESSGHVI